MRSAKEIALEIENYLKKECSKEISEYKAGKRSSCRVKVNYMKTFIMVDKEKQKVYTFKNDKEIVEEYNKRNDNDAPWFPPVQRK